MWFRNPADTTKVYVLPSDTKFFYLMNLPGLDAGGASAYINNYMAKSKYYSDQYSDSSGGVLYNQTTDKLTYVTSNFSPNTSTTQTVRIGQEIVPYPTAIVGLF